MLPVYVEILDVIKNKLILLHLCVCLKEIAFIHCSSAMRPLGGSKQTDT